MRRTCFSISVLTICAALLHAEHTQSKTEAESKTACHGTAVEFASSPVAAAKQAGKEKKLVLVLHVSGHFEDPTFT